MAQVLRHTVLDEMCPEWRRSALQRRRQPGSGRGRVGWQINDQLQELALLKRETRQARNAVHIAFTELRNARDSPDRA